MRSSSWWCDSVVEKSRQDDNDDDCRCCCCGKEHGEKASVVRLVVHREGIVAVVVAVVARVRHDGKTADRQGTFLNEVLDHLIHAAAAAVADRLAWIKDSILRAITTRMAQGDHVR